MPLKRELTLFELTLCGIGIIVGAGVYALIADGAELAGNAVWLSFVFAAIVAATTGLSYAELSSMFPKSGAEYDYVRHAFGHRAAFVVAWLAIFASIVGIATVSMSFGHYLSPYLSNCSIGQACKGIEISWVECSLFLILFSMALMLLGIKKSAGIAAVITAVSVFGLLIVIAAGLPKIGSYNLLEVKSFDGLIKASALVFFAFIGFEEIVRLSEETKDAEKNVPRAIILAIMLTTVLYILSAISAINILGWQELASAPNALAVVAQKSLGDQGYLILSLIAMFATSSTVILIMLATSRMLYGMSKEHALPEALSRVSKSGVPYVAVFVTTLLSLLMLSFGSIDFVANTVNFSIFLIFIIINISLVKLRFTMPAKQRPFKVPLSIARVPVVPVVGIVVTLALLMSMEMSVIAFGGLATVAGILIAIFYE